MAKQRLCNIYGCWGVMRPTRKMWDCGGKIQNSNHRIFQCIECGNEQPWVANPNLDGSFAELHKLEDGSPSGLSMMSDVDFYPPKQASSTNRRRIR